MKKIIPIVIISIVIFLVVGYFIFNYTVKTITEREVRRITQQEIGRITNEETARITDEITKQKTEEITRKMFGGDIGSQEELKEVECDKAPAQRQFNSATYYNGALIDAHLHMPFTFEVPKAIYEEADWDAPILEKEVATGEIICDFEKEKINSAFGFYVVPSLLKGQALDLIKQVEQKHAGRIVPFLMPAHVSGLDQNADDADEILNSNKGLFKGYGEIAFYRGSFKGVSPDDPSMLEIYKIADKHNLIVMIHPDNGQRQAIERILQDYSNIIFLFHGADNMRSYATDIVKKYPNAYFTIDGDLWDIPNEHEGVNLYDAKGGKEEFVFEFKRDYNKVLSGAIAAWKDPIEKYPDKFLWGTDRGYEMHFDPEVGALLEEIARSFIGQLSPEAQEKFAYKNAERLLQER